MKNEQTRREMLKNSVLAGFGLTLFGAEVKAASRDENVLAELIAGPAQKNRSMIDVPFERHETVRLGIIGTGLRGRSVLGEFLNVPNVRITALCDIVQEKADRAKAMVTKAGQPEPAVYVKGDRGYEEMLKRDDIDFVFIATPWEWHVPQALAAMNAGKHVGVEVPAGYTIKELWQLVDTSEKTRRHMMMMENCCYDYDELLILNMVRDGIFGEVIHGEAAYNHDLRAILFETKDEGLWRRAHHVLRDSNLYPTHGLGPVANYMNVNRGDKFDFMVAMSSGSLGLQDYRKEHLAADDPRQKEVYKCGDYNTNLIKTAKGRSIMVQHNVTTPRPYDRINLIQGTKGIFRDYPSRIYIEKDKADHRWQTIDAYKEKFEHSLWRVVGEQARKLGGHGGMDYLMCWRLVQCMREGLIPDMDVYDAAAWSAPGPLSEISVQKGSAPVKFPDFTRGKWNTTRKPPIPS
ncbi:MAG: Gfo/Idh/MocA family oxidoreductase [Acidobacteria bacterium]|nr:Gfo/Idh/MocA family oxidoreductase [Acidobacteriota bacterium]